MDARKLNAIMTAIDLGSFSKAAESVGYTQSGLTHLVNNLEKELGFPIVHRDHMGIALTQEGRQLLPYIRSFLDADQQLQDKTEEIRKGIKQTIRIAAYASIAMKWMPEILYRFARICPNVEVSLRMVDDALQPFELLKEGKTDVIFASYHHAPHCKWTPLYREKMYAIIPESQHDKSDVYPIEMMKDQTFLMPYGRFDLDIHAIFNRYGIAVKEKEMHVDDETLIRMVAKGMGVTIMSEMMIRGSHEGVTILPLSPAEYRQIGAGIRMGEDEKEPLVQLKKCVMDYVSSLTH